MESILNIVESPVGPQGDITLVRPVGKLHSGTYRDFEARLMGIMAAGRHRLVVDMGEVPFCSSAGIRALISVQKEARKQGGDLQLANLVPEVRKVFGTAGLDQILQVHDTVEAALTRLG